MAAPIGNQFWKLRSKHGRDRIFTDPAVLLLAAEEYFEWCETNPMEEQDFRGKDATEVTIKKLQPFQLSGLCLYLEVNPEYFNDFEKGLRPSESPTDKEFSRIVTRIRQIIYTQKFRGAAVGFFNQNIIARDLGLIDRKDLTTNGESFVPPTIIVEPNPEITGFVVSEEEDFEDLL